MLAIEVGGTNVKIALFDIPLAKQGKIKQCENRGVDDLVLQVQNVLQEEGVLMKVNNVNVAMFGPVKVGNAADDGEDVGIVLKGTCGVKQGWVGRSLAKEIANMLGVQMENVYVETDVNAACLGEFKLGNHPVKKNSNMAYITVGTGVGVGILINGQPLHGILHPEAGHIK